MKKLFIFSILYLSMALGITPVAWAQYDPCAIATFPYTEGFESVSSGLPTCFSRNPIGYYQVNNTIQPYVSNYQPHTGSNALRAFNNSYTASSDTVPTFIFPQLDSQFDMSSMVLEFWARPDYNAAPYLVVGVMDDPLDQSSFTDVETLNFSTPNTYTKFTVYFSSYAGTGRYIAIKIANTPVTYGQVCIDDIILDVAAMCSPVLNLAVDNIFDADVTIKWQPNTLGGASMYNVRLVNLDDESESYANTTDTFYTFTGLSYSTNYRAFVTVTCLDNQESSADSVSFTTPLPSIPFPYFETFEGDTIDFLPLYSFSGTGPNQWTYGAATGVPDQESGSAIHALYVSVDSGATNTYDYHQASTSYAVINVSFPNVAMEYRLAFDYKVKGRHSGYMAFDYLSVYMINAGEEMTTDWDGTPIGTPLLSEAANVTEWTHHDVILPNVAGSSKQIIFFWKNFGSSDNLGDLNPPAAIDNISISGTMCAQPNALSISDITNESATLSWHENGTATNWNVYYKIAESVNDYTEVQVSGDTFTTVTALSSNTEYMFYVVADCGDEVSNPSVSATFHTGCGPITELPFTENFETGLYSTSQNTFISCWNRLTSNNEHFAYIGDAFWNAHGGDHFLDFHYTPNCFDIAIMPELGEDIDASDLLVTFYACHTNYGYYTLGTLEIGVMTDPNDTSSFVVVDTINISDFAAYTYSDQLISLINYSGSGKYIAFRVSNCDGCGYYIDDITLSLRPACMNPVNFSALNVTNESVTLTWNELGNATAWTIQYDTVGFTAGQGTNTVTATANPFTVTGLDNLTAYDFYVQANCGDSLSEWTGPLFIATGVLNMGTSGADTLTTCEAIISDNGGVNGDYSSYCDYTVLVYPATEGSGLQITGMCDLNETSYGESHLYFHEGESTNGTLIASYTGSHSNIAVASSGPITIHFTSSYYTASGFILNVACASCTPPANLAVENLTPTSASISWEGNADQYSVYLTGSETVHATTNASSYTFNGLSSNTTYSVQVRSLCGTDSSLLSPVATFTTPCEAVTITADNPWTEDFEGYAGSGNQPFQCWARPVVDNVYNAPFVYCGWEPSCHSGANSAELKGSSEMLVLPLFSNDVHDLRLSFWATSTDPSSGTLEIGVISNTLDPNSFELVGMAGTPGPRGTDSTGNGNYMGPFDFSTVTAANGRIALRYNNSFASYNSWNLDDFVVELAPDCAVPTDLAVSNITTSEATVTWTNGATATAWALQYKADAVTDWGTEIYCTSSAYTLTYLVPLTTYQVRVKAICDSLNESAWSIPVSFTTESAVVIEEPTVETAAASNITMTSAILNATITDPGNQTIIARGFEWKLSTAESYANIAGFGTGNTFSTTLTDLTASTDYTFRAYVSTINGTQYGEPLTFTTLSDMPEPCEAPTDLQQQIALKDEGGIHVCWTDNANASQWNLQYRLLNSGEWITVVVTGSPCYSITGLINNEDYEIRVQAVCADDNLSIWSDILIATASNSGIEDHLANRISLYPNPANDVVNVECTMNNVQCLGVEVIDVYGKVINTLNVTENPTRINVSGLSAGMYFVRVTTEEGSATKIFVKK